MATINVFAGDDLQAAINAASLGDTLDLERGATFEGNFYTPLKSGGSYLTIKTEGELPIGRVAPGDSGPFAKIVSSVSGIPPLVTRASSHHYQFTGLEFHGASDGDGNILSLGSADEDTFGPTGYVQNNLSLVPHHFTLDRCYIHGDATNGQKRGVALHCGEAVIRGCYISDVKWNGQDSQAVGGYNGPGPYLIENNYLEASGENVLFGGADALISGLIPSHITLIYNTVFKPLDWRGVWQVKNLLELKNARYVHIAYNTFTNCWADAQDGYAIQFTVRNQGGANPWATVQDVECDHNLIDSCGAGFNILGEDDSGNTSVRAARINIHRNLLTNIHTSFGGPACLLVIQWHAEDVTFNHNTCISNGASTVAVGDRAPFANFRFTNNIIMDNGQAIRDDEGYGNDCIARDFPESEIRRNIIIGANSSLYPLDNYYPANVAAVHFENAGSGDYRLAASSPYKNGGTDGTDPGALSALSTPGSHLVLEGFTPNPTIVTVANGDWHDPTIWSTGAVPTGSSWVQINHAVTLSANATCWTCYISPVGSLTGSGTFVWTFSNTAYTDSEQFETGLIVAGRMEMGGSSKTPWSRATGEIAAGATTLRVIDYTGWAVGDRLVLPDTRQLVSGGPAFAPEVVTITNISGGGVITFTPATAIAHPGSRDGFGVLERTPPVGNLTRSIVLQSANPAGTRAHSMYADDARVALAYVAFHDMGRTTTAPLHNVTNHKGRYAVHFHHLAADGTMATVGCAIERSSKWGMSVHDSRGHAIHANVVYDASGWGIGTEDGSEDGNTFTQNLVVGITGTGGRGDARLDDWGHNGTGLWFQGPRNIVVGNVAANCLISGYAVWSLTENGAPLVDTTALNTCDDNEAVACGANDSGAFALWYVGRPDVESYVDHLYIWHTRAGAAPDIYMYPVTRVWIRDWKARGDFNSFPPIGGGYFASDYVQSQSGLIRPDIANHQVGIEMPRGTRPSPPMVLPASPFEVIEPVFKNNVRDVEMITASLASDPSQQTDLVMNVRNPRHLGTYPGGFYYWKQLNLAPAENIRVKLDIFVFGFQGVSGDDWEVFAAEQDPSAIMAQTGAFTGLIGSPDSGRTNAQNFADHGICSLGKVTPTTAIAKAGFRSSANALSTNTFPVSVDYSILMGLSQGSAATVRAPLDVVITMGLDQDADAPSQFDEEQNPGASTFDMATSVDVQLASDVPLAALFGLLQDATLVIPPTTPHAVRFSDREIDIASFEMVLGVPSFLPLLLVPSFVAEVTDASI